MLGALVVLEEDWWFTIGPQSRPRRERILLTSPTAEDATNSCRRSDQDTTGRNLTYYDFYVLGYLIAAAETAVELPYLKVSVHAQAAVGKTDVRERERGIREHGPVFSTSWLICWAA